MVGPRIPGQGGGGALSVDDDKFFANAIDRDVYFSANPIKLKDGVHVSVNGQLQKYIGAQDEFVDVTPVITGPSGQDAPDFKLQYSADGSTNWSNTLNSSIHKYWRWSTDNGVTWSPDGARYSAATAVSGIPDPYSMDVGVNGKLQLFKNNVMIQEQDETGAWIADSVKTGTGSLHIGDLFSAGSAGRHMTWVNHDNNTAYHAAASGVSLDGSSTTPLTTSVVGALGFDYPNGNSPTVVSIDYNYTFTAPINAVFYGLTMRAGEDFTGRLRWKVVDVNNNLEVASFYTNVDVFDYDTFPISFKYPLWAELGKTYRLTLTKDDGSLFKVKAGDDGVTPYRVNEVAPYTDHLVFHEGSPEVAAASLNTLMGSDRISFDAIKNAPLAAAEVAGLVKLGPTMSIDGEGKLNTNVAAAEKKVVASEAAMLALPQISNLYIVTRTDVNRLYYLNANDDPSLLSNWESGPSVADTVASFNGRVGDVVPQIGDYTLDQVTTADVTTATEYKLVIDSGKLYMEEV